MMFEGFVEKKFELEDAVINYRMGGSGPALLMLHGFPQSHVHWHVVAPKLKDHFTLVMPDLRGYGDSIGPEPDSNHLNYSKRTMASDMIALMASLDMPTFRLIGHDRGARVAYRLTLDHPEKVTHLVSIDTVPTLDIWEAMDMGSALESFHWPFLAQPAPLPERMIGADPDFFLSHLLETWVGNAQPLDPMAVAEYQKHMRKPSVIQAMAEDYRAGATVDVSHDQMDRLAGKKISCPVFVPYGNQYTPNSLLTTWAKWANSISELSIDCGHFVAEEAPEELASYLLEVL